MNNDSIVSSSFRDPSGFLFYKNDELYRQINNSYKEDDSQVQRLLASREDIFDEYTQDKFEEEFDKFFTIQQIFEVKDSKRILYSMKKR